MTEAWPEWRQRIARGLLNHLATAAHARSEWETAARLFCDAREARGSGSKAAFARSLRVAKVADTKRWLAELEKRMEDFARMADAYAIPRDTRSPIERMIDQATGHKP